MDDAERKAAALDLSKAKLERRPIRPLTETFGSFGVEDAYAVQQLFVEQLAPGPNRTLGHKVGLTSVVMQSMLGVSQPDFGHLLESMFYAESSAVPLSELIQPKVEPEVAFVLGRELSGPGVTMAHAVRAVEYVLPALEIIDSRIVDWKISLSDTIADNASSGGVVLGGTARRLEGLELRTIGCNLWHGGALAATGAAGAVLGNPLNSLVWLANTLGSLGEGLMEGEVVLPGSCTVAVPVTAGDEVRAFFAGLGSVGARFEGSAP